MLPTFSKHKVWRPSSKAGTSWSHRLPIRSIKSAPPASLSRRAAAYEFSAQPAAGLRRGSEGTARLCIERGDWTARKDNASRRRDGFVEWVRRAPSRAPDRGGRSCSLSACRGPGAERRLAVGRITRYDEGQAFAHRRLRGG